MIKNLILVMLILGASMIISFLRNSRSAPLTFRDELASAEVTQKTVRIQRLPDGTLHKVEAGAVQRETWKRTEEGWKMYKVDNIRGTGIFVDDKPYKPASP